jgi:hypothetical protein
MDLPDARDTAHPCRPTVACTADISAPGSLEVLPAPFGVTLEGYVFSDAPPVAPRDGGIRGAIGVTTRAWLVFDFGADAGFLPSTREYSAFVGMTVIRAIFWRPS